MAYVLPELPYAQDGLEPHISAKTLSFHYGKHHAAYVNNMNNMVKGTELEGKSLCEIIEAAAKGGAEKTGLFNNSAQVFNHNFYWKSMKPGGGGAPSGKVAALIQSSFGGFDAFFAEFKKAATTQFGSGWAWLVIKDGVLSVVKTANACMPDRAFTLLAVCDVWEHAYYLDYQNRRPDYVDTFLKHLVNWEFIEANLPK